MISLRHSLALLTLVAITTAAPLVRADALPPDDCSGNVGKACQTAGPSFNQAGTCVADTCHHPLPDGGSMPYDCARCVLPDAGPPAQDASVPDTNTSSSSGSTSSSGASGSSGAPDASPPSDPASTDLKSSSSSCSMSPRDMSRAGGWFAGFGLAMVGMISTFVLRRRKKS